MDTTPPASPDNLHYKGSATEALEVLAQTQTHQQLLDTLHAMWCGPDCPKDRACSLFHYHRPASASVSLSPQAAVRSRYNKDTAGLYTLMGGDGYVPGVLLQHQTNAWPLVEAVVQRVDGGSKDSENSKNSENTENTENSLRVDYTDWSKKHARSAGELVTYASRDTVQWLATWMGAAWDWEPAVAHYCAFTTVPDDLCIPPRDLVQGRFRMHGRGVWAVAEALEQAGWGQDATYMVLVLVRQYLVQYVEKVDRLGSGPEAKAGARTTGLHDTLAAAGIWDSVVYRTHTANCWGLAVAIARGYQTGPVMAVWHADSSICDALSMDLCKSALGIDAQDDFQPTAPAYDHDEVSARKSAYHAVYLDLIDDLVQSGAPEPLVHYGRAGFLFVQVNHRYQERRLGRRMAVTATMEKQLARVFGTQSPADPWVEEVFRAREG